MSTESFWDRHDLGPKIVDLLAGIQYFDPGHHFGRPFVTAYQLAILFKERYPEDFRRFGHPLGGQGSGEHYSFASYLAGQLSRKMANDDLPEIEGGFLSNECLQVIAFDDDGDTVTSSLTGSEYDLSMFRLR